MIGIRWIDGTPQRMRVMRENCEQFEELLEEVDVFPMGDQEAISKERKRDQAAISKMVKLFMTT
jgi:hypothetical protein